MNTMNGLLEKHQELLRQRIALYQQLQKINSEIDNCENEINSVEQKIYELLDSEDA
jgi:Tfp pilus assembly protein PilN